MCDFSECAKFMQYYKSEVRELDQWVNLTCSQKESIDMMIHKIGRIMSGDVTWLDSWYDIQGYCTLVIDLDECFTKEDPNTRTIVINKSFFKQASNSGDTYCKYAANLMTLIVLCVMNPRWLEPWLKINKQVQVVIDQLESEGGKRIQR